METSHINKIGKAISCKASTCILFSLHLSIFAALVSCHWTSIRHRVVHLDEYLPISTCCLIAAVSLRFYLIPMSFSLASHFYHYYIEWKALANTDHWKSRDIYKEFKISRARSVSWGLPPSTGIWNSWGTNSSPWLFLSAALSLWFSSIICLFFVAWLKSFAIILSVTSRQMLRENNKNRYENVIPIIST